MKRILTGIKPTGKIHLGNYLGFIKDLLIFQKKYQVFLMIADLHAQTVPYHPKELKNNVIELTKSLIALGVDPHQSIIFKQSDISAHLYLCWFLSCLSYVGELERMHEFKEQKERFKKIGVGAGILLYPVLQAADILIYNADLVPVGKDQIQHLELARELARRFNQRFGKTFKIPEAYFNPETEKIMSLDNPSKKMSKSLPEGCLEIFASEKEIKNKIFKSVTDSEKIIKYDPLKKPGISNLIIIYKHLTNKSIDEIENEFRGLMYNDLKEKIYLKFIQHFSSARSRYQQIKEKNVVTVLEQGKKKAEKVAQDNLAKIFKLVGLK